MHCLRRTALIGRWNIFPNSYREIAERMRMDADWNGKDKNGLQILLKIKSLGFFTTGICSYVIKSHFVLVGCAIISNRKCSHKNAAE